VYVTSDQRARASRLILDVSCVAVADYGRTYALDDGKGGLMDANSGEGHKDDAGEELG
jgi:hypothetical protein